MSKIKFALAAATLLFPLLANAGSPFAPRPLSITAVEDGVNSAGLAYTTYSVKCSNRSNAPLTAWKEERRWCAADGSGTCSRDKIRAAQAACKLRPIGEPDSNESMIGSR